MNKFTKMIGVAVLATGLTTTANAGIVTGAIGGAIFGDTYHEKTIAGCKTSGIITGIIATALVINGFPIVPAILITAIDTVTGCAGGMVAAELQNAPRTEN